MWTEAGPLRQMRAQARSLLPPRAFLRLDRNDYLFVTNAPVFEPSLSEIPGFIAHRRGSLLCLLPDASWVMRLERKKLLSPDWLCQSLLRFRNEKPDLDNLKLFARCVRAADNPLPEEMAFCRQAVGQRAAVALRGGCSGGLYACALLLSP